ncbi:tetratricopeptide repeat protein, partial [Solirubrobacter soli]|uniref:tetratricopeptide repeat protein n=1 Tax=Solirubrobacter soli TaxID=363832 RepID=UPI000484CEEB
QLGILAQARGDLAEAETLYRRSLEINERLGNPARIATGYHQLGMLAQARGDVDAEMVEIARLVAMFVSADIEAPAGVRTRLTQIRDEVGQQRMTATLTGTLGAEVTHAVMDLLGKDPASPGTD